MRLRPLLLGQVLVGAASRWPRVVRALIDVHVDAIEAVGKHLLMDLSDGTTLRVHLGMKGRWRQVPPGEPIRVSMGDVSLRLDTAGGTALCTRAPTVERFRTREKATHRVLRRLGPDVLGEGFDPAVAAVRAARSRWPTAAEVLLDQGVACGIGNVYKSELLFVLRTHPFAPTDSVAHDTWEGLYAKAATLMRANLRPAPRNTTGLGPGRPLHWVYGRRGRPCLRCGSRVQSKMQGSDLPRVTYWCARCQHSGTVHD